MGQPAPWYWRACKAKVAEDASAEAQASLMSSQDKGPRGQRATTLGTLLWSMAEDIVGLTPHY